MSDRTKIRRLTVATYNVHRCIGTDRRLEPDRVVDVLRALDADVVGLQEVDMQHRVDGESQLTYIGQSLGMTAVMGPNLLHHKGHFGNALLTRLPLRAVRRVDLSVERYEPRGLIDAHLGLGPMEMRVIVTHLGLRSAERRHQVSRLQHALDEHGPRPMVVMGDFNEWKPTQGALRVLNRRLGASMAPRTFPSRFPLLPLDRIWVWPAHGLTRLTVYASQLARVASDHLPLLAEIAWDEETERSVTKTI